MMPVSLRETLSTQPTGHVTCPAVYCRMSDDIEGLGEAMHRTEVGDEVEIDLALIRDSRCRLHARSYRHMF